MKKRTVATAELKAQLDELLAAVRERGESVVIEEDGRPVAAIVSADRFDAMEHSRERFLEAVRRTWAANADVPDEVLQQEVEAAVREVRAERATRAG